MWQKQYNKTDSNVTSWSEYPMIRSRYIFVITTTHHLKAGCRTIWQKFGNKHCRFTVGESAVYFSSCVIKIGNWITVIQAIFCTWAENIHIVKQEITCALIRILKKSSLDLFLFLFSSGCQAFCCHIMYLDAFVNMHLSWTMRCAYKYVYILLGIFSLPMLAWYFIIFPTQKNKNTSPI